MKIAGYEKPGGAAAWWCIVFGGVPFLAALSEIFLFRGSTLPHGVGVAVEVFALASFIIAPVLACVSVVKVFRARGDFTALHFAPIAIVLLQWGFIVLAALQMLGG